MREQCIRAVESAIGRPLREAETRNIEQRIQSAMLRGAREDPAAWRAMSPEQRMTEAGRRAGEELNATAAKQVQRAEATILAHDRVANFRASQVAEGSDANGVDALERTLVHKYDEKNGGFQPIESRANATFDFALSQIGDIFDAVNPGLWQRVQQGIWRMEPLRRAFVNALHGVEDPTIPTPIRDAAARYHEMADALREQFNAAGGVIGKLEDWGAPHNWSSRLTQRAGREQFVEDMAAWADRSKYVHEDGTHYTPDEMRDFFSEAYDTIVSEGMTKDSGSPFPGGAVKANRGSHHRVIHLKPDANYEALRRYSEQNILEAMVGSLRRMSRDVSLVETFGPNADYQFRLQLDRAKTEAAKINPELAPKLEQRARGLQNLYDQLAGNNPPPSSRRVSDAFATMRNLQIASKLGSAVISSIGDFPTLYQTAILNKLNPFKVALNSAIAWSPKSRRYARRMGLMLDGLTHEMERYSNENLTSKDWSSRTASAVVNLSGLPFVTDARRLGYSMTMMDAIGHLTRQRQYADVSKLHANDAGVLASKGITQASWEIWRAANVDTWGANHTLLTPDAIMAVEGPSFEAKRQAAIDLLAIVREEQDLAVITPGHRERWQMLDFTGQPHGGTIGGEIVRSMFLFKSFPWALMTRHWERSGMYGTGGRTAYLANLFIFMTLGGVAANWINDLLGGKDPRNMNVMTDDPHARSIAVRNWISGGLKGGALGVYGDFLFSETNSYSGNSLSEQLMGPNVSTAAQALGLTVGNATAIAGGDGPLDERLQNAHVGSEAVRFARSITPGSNLLWTKAFTDRVIWNQLMEMAEPGSIDRMRDRQESQQGTSYFWDPLQPAPDRAPDLNAAVH